MIILGLTFIIATCFMVICKKKYLKFVYIALTTMLAIIAFNFDPIKAYYLKGNYTDLFRFYDVLDNIRILGYDYLLSHSDYSMLFISRWYVYILSFFENNGIFVAITCLLEYGIIFYVINKFSKINNSSKLGIILSAIFFIFSIDFCMNISNVRAPLVFCIYFLSIYKEFIENKKNKLFWFIYVLLCFLHQLAIILLFFRIIILFYNKYTEKFINICLIFWSIPYSSILSLLSTITSNQYIYQMTGKLNYYNNITVNREIALILISCIKIVLSLIMLRYFRKKIKAKLKNEYNDFYSIGKMLTYFSLGSFLQYDMFLRLPNLLTYFLIIWIQINLGNVENLKIEENINIRRQHIFSRYIYFLLIILFSLFCIIYYFGGYSYHRIIF